MTSTKKQDSDSVAIKPALSEAPKTVAENVDVYLELPRSYKKEYASVFKTLPPEMRRYLHERESEVERGFSKINNELNARRWLDEAFGARAERLCRCGINKPREWVEIMARIDDALDSDPKTVLQMLSEIYGCQPTSTPAPQAPLDVAELISRLERTEVALKELNDKLHDSHLQAQKLEEAKKAKDISFAPHGKISKPDLSKLSTREVLELKMAEYE